MVLAIALGIGASMTTLTVLHVLSGDPMPDQSAQLYYPQVDPQDLKGMTAEQGAAGSGHLIDGLNLLRAGTCGSQGLDDRRLGAAEPSSPRSIRSTWRRATPRRISFRCSKRRFCMARGWTAADDEAKAREVVIARSLNDKLFAGSE
jgi:putative ABC transport system permease protein